MGRNSEVYGGKSIERRDGIALEGADALNRRGRWARENSLRRVLPEGRNGRGIVRRYGGR